MRWRKNVSLKRSKENRRKLSDEQDELDFLRTWIKTTRNILANYILFYVPHLYIFHYFHYSIIKRRLNCIHCTVWRDLNPRPLGCELYTFINRSKLILMQHLKEQNEEEVKAYKDYFLFWSLYYIVKKLYNLILFENK